MSMAKRALEWGKTEYHPRAKDLVCKLIQAVNAATLHYKTIPIYSVFFVVYKVQSAAEGPGCLPCSLHVLSHHKFFLLDGR